jgi:copper chaperone
MIESTVLTVTGMKCGGCENTIKEKLLAVGGISAVTASFKDKQVMVEFDDTQTDLDTLIDVITEAGFNVED